MSDEAFARYFPWEVTFVAQMVRRRNAAGWTQTDLARKLRTRGLPFHQPTVQRIEKGERAVRLDEAYVIAELFGVSLDAMLTSFEGHLEVAANAVDRAQSKAEVALEGANEWFLEFLEEYEQLALAFMDQYREDEQKATPEVIWMAAWLIKLGWVIDSWTDLEQFVYGLNTKSDDWVDEVALQSTVTAARQDLRWLDDETIETWAELPAHDRPHLLADKSAAYLQAWIVERTNGEHPEA